MRGIEGDSLALRSRFCAVGICLGCAGHSQKLLANPTERVPVIRAPSFHNVTLPVVDTFECHRFTVETVACNGSGHGPESARCDATKKILHIARVAGAPLIKIKRAYLITAPPGEAPHERNGRAV